MLYIKVRDHIKSNKSTIKIQYSDLSTPEIKQFVSLMFGYDADQMIVEFENTIIYNRLSDLDILDNCTIDVHIDYASNINKQMNCGKTVIMAYILFALYFVIKNIFHKN